MTAATKRILVVARRNHPEALRVAAGLTLLDDRVRVAVIGALADTQEVREQREVLDFADVPCEEFVSTSSAGLARAVLESDLVYVL